MLMVMVVVGQITMTMAMTMMNADGDDDAGGGNDPLDCYDSFAASNRCKAGLGPQPLCCLSRVRSDPMPGGGAPAIDAANKALAKQMHDEGYSYNDMLGEIYRIDGKEATKSAIAYIIQ
jgi:hypothetical protein